MAFYRERGLKELGNEIGTEGVGIGGGFIVGGLVGRQVENMVMKSPVTDTSTIVDKLIAWGANNGAKAAIYLLAKHYDAKSAITNEATKALAGSIVYDTVLRLANNGVNAADVNLAGYRILGANGQPVDVQKLVQENSILRTELNKALQKLAGGRPAGLINIPDSPDLREAGVPSPAVQERQRRYGAMPYTPDVMERQRRYGAMPFQQNPPTVARQNHFGFMSGTSLMENAVPSGNFGML